MLSMIKEKLNNFTKSIFLFIKSRSVLIGSLIIIVGTSLLIFDIYDNKQFEKNEQEEIKEFLIGEPDDVVLDSDGEVIENNYNPKYIAVIEIPSIKLKGGMVNPASKDNNVNKHIQIIKGSNFPNVVNGNFILAAHSGRGKAAYFSNLNKVKLGDLIYIYYSGTEYFYKVTNKYTQAKTGKVAIHRDKDATTLTLITCLSSNIKKEQLVVIAELIGINAYGGD